MSLRLIRNPHAVQRITKRWGKLAEPIHASDNQNKMLAVSWLRGLSMRDSEPVFCSDLSNSQAADIANWLRR